MSTRSNRNSPEYLELLQDANMPEYLDLIDQSSNYMQPLPSNDGPVESISMKSPTSTTRAEVNESGPSPASGSPDNGNRQAPNRLLLPIPERPTHLDLPQHNLEHPNTGTGSQLESVDEYDLNPAQRRFLGRSPEKSKKSKKSLYICIIISVVAIVTTTLTSILTVGKSIESILNEKYSSLKTLHVQSKEELLEAINRGGCNVTADLIVKSSGTCYCLYMKQLSWNSAREFCLSKGKVYLAEILKKEDNDFLIPYLQKGETKQGVWLGASSLSGEWRWNYSGRRLEQFEPSQWDVGQPSAFSPQGYREHCLEVFNWTSSIYKWNDISCSYTKPFLCSSKESDCCC